MKMPFAGKIRRLVLPCLVLCCAAFTIGCDLDSDEDIFEWLSDDADMEPAKSVISVHSIIKYPRGDISIEKNVHSYFGKDVCINTLPLITSQDISNVTMIPRESDSDMYDLMLTFTDRGRKMWIGLSVPNRNTELAFAIDGMVYRKFTPRLITDTAVNVIVDGPFDPATAHELSKNAKKTHRKLNRK